MDNFHRWGLWTVRPQACQYWRSFDEPEWKSDLLLWVLHTRHLAGWIFEKFQTSDLWTWNFSLDRGSTSVVKIHCEKIGGPLFGQRCSQIGVCPCKCFHSSRHHPSCRLHRIWIQMSLLSLVRKSCQPQQPVWSAVQVRLYRCLVEWCIPSGPRLASAHVRMGNQRVRWQLKTNLNLSNWRSRLEARTKYAPSYSFSWKQDQPIETSPTVQTLREKKALSTILAIAPVSHVEHFIFGVFSIQNAIAAILFISLETQPRKKPLSKEQCVWGENRDESTRIHVMK